MRGVVQHHHGKTVLGDADVDRRVAFRAGGRSDVVVEATSGVAVGSSRPSVLGDVGSYSGPAIIPVINQLIGLDPSTGTPMWTLAVPDDGQQLPAAVVGSTQPDPVSVDSPPGVVSVGEGPVLVSAEFGGEIVEAFR
jgi:outer membrane protein assembly factor BamB